MEVLVLLGSFAVLCALGMPVAYALGLSALIAAAYVEIPLEAVMLKISDGTDDFALLAIPFFVLAGGIMAEGGMAARLFLAGVFPGLLFALCLIGLVLWTAHKRGMPKSEPIPLRQIPRIALEAS